MDNLLLYLIAYLLGSIPFGLILSKRFANVNIKESGSKSIGATNVLRVIKEKDPKLAKKLGIATLLLDAIKGIIALLIGMMFNAPLEVLWAMAILSVFGHCYSIFLSFEGGKGVATGFGVLLFLNFIPTIIGAIVWFISAKTIKISSLSSLIGLLGVIFATIILNNGLGVESNAPLYFIAFIIFYKHIPNIIRLLEGKEGKVI